MGIKDLLEAKREEILKIASRNGVHKLWVFGSVARGEADDESDIDLLIEVGGPTPPWFPGGLVAELEELLGHRVDIVEAGSLRQQLRERVLAEAIPL